MAPEGARFQVLQVVRTAPGDLRLRRSHVTAMRASCGGNVGMHGRNASLALCRACRGGSTNRPFSGLQHRLIPVFTIDPKNTMQRFGPVTSSINVNSSTWWNAE